MNKLTWDEVYDTHIPSIDRQHRKLFDFINELDAILSRGSLGHELSMSIMMLTTYVKAHFKYEELLLKKFHYPDMSQHLAAHKQWFQDIEKYKHSIDLREEHAAEYFLMFLREWFIFHVLADDQQYALFLLEQGVD